MKQHAKIGDALQAYTAVIHKTIVVRIVVFNLASV